MLDFVHSFAQASAGKSKKIISLAICRSSSKISAYPPSITQKMTLKTLIFNQFSLYARIESHCHAEF